MDLKIDTPDDLPLTEEKITVEVDKLMYYQKPALGGQGHPAVPASLAGQDSSFPIQIIFPSGNFGLGIPLSYRSEQVTEARRSDVAAIMSMAEYSEDDAAYRRGITFIFLALFIVNLVLTASLYANVSVLDLSKVEPYEGIPFYFGKVAETRTYQENLSFGFTIIILIIGAIAALAENPTLISAFCYALIMNFILGTQSLPSYAYSMRYILDIFMIYLGLVLRLKCNTSFLPVHMHMHGS